MRLNASQMAAARVVVSVGKGMGIAMRGIALGLAVALQESSLNPSSVKGRSAGLFQQQGEYYQHIDRLDPAAASWAFYDMLLKRVPGYADPANVSFAAAAQEVQRSGAGAHWYARYERWATAMAHQLYDGAPTEPRPGQPRCKVGGGSGPIKVLTRGLTVVLPPEAGVTGEVTAPTAQAATAIAAALSYLGTPYAWGGGGTNGPGKGIRDNGQGDRHRDYEKTGFDCSGLTQYAWAQAGIHIARHSGTQFVTGRSKVDWNAAQPGALLFWTRAKVTHVAIFLGRINKQLMMVEAPHSGSVVKVSPVREELMRSQAVHSWTDVAR
ncbi:NlpC/P60 family protein [Crossiella sp. SN42]|uniref:C40 family peptidase n=1 Tax=Crossiella sp. SN42 TaxID=2944808 RepID=UPI00207CC1A3|nr:NlpC/P60 family protein [Crossiella sp. SN42]MCO1575584.1 NlpC/P60 family protein [Crossiella sp. SN42]